VIVESRQTKNLLYMASYKYIIKIITMCLFVYSDVQHILCCVCFFLCLRLVYPMLPVSLECLFLITPLVFSCSGHNIFFFRDRSMIIGMWVHDHKAVCRVQ
jgi:hypothetical protein